MTLALSEEDDDSSSYSGAGYIIGWAFVGIICVIAAVALLVLLCKTECCGLFRLIRRIFKVISSLISCIIKSILLLPHLIFKGITRACGWRPKKNKRNGNGYNDGNNNRADDPEMGNVQHNVGFAAAAGAAGLLPNLQKPAPVVAVQEQGQGPPPVHRQPQKKPKPANRVHHGVLVPRSPRIAYVAFAMENERQARHDSSAGLLFPAPAVVRGAPVAVNNNNNDRNNNREEEIHPPLPESDDESMELPPLADSDGESLVSVPTREDSGRAYSL